jgi:hypothetical protein
MSIGSVIQKGDVVYIYDEKGRQISNIAVGIGKDHGLQGYTSGNVSIRRGSYIYIYDEKGKQIGNMPA